MRKKFLSALLSLCMILTLLPCEWRYFGSPAAAADLGVFSDSDAVSAWALDAMCWAVSTGLVNGENNRLNPGDDAARAQVAALLMHFCQSTEILPG